MFFFLHLIDCGFFKSFLNLLGVDRFFVLIFRFVLQFFFVIFQWFFSSLFFIFSIFETVASVVIIWMCGDFLFSILFFFYLQLPSLFSSFFFFCFVSIFMSKKIICFIFIFRGDHLSNGFAQKAPARVFLQKLQRRHGTTESNRHFFPFFWLFYIYLCIYMFIHILELHFYHFI